MALMKVKGNLERLFDKNLNDLVRGIRNNKEDEAKYIAGCLEEIKVELRQSNAAVKSNAVAKLCYLQMLGKVELFQDSLLLCATYKCICLLTVFVIYGR